MVMQPECYFNAMRELKEYSRTKVCRYGLTMEEESANIGQIPDLCAETDIHRMGFAFAIFILTAKEQIFG
jgi:hypothetical protein